jgi:hypothetical protein
MKRSSFCCEINQTKDVRGAPGLEEENGPGEGVFGSPSTADSSGYARRHCGLRRAILPAWRRFERGEKEGNGRGSRGLLIGAEIDGHYSGLLRGLSHRRFQ